MCSSETDGCSQASCGVALTHRKAGARAESDAIRLSSPDRGCVPGTATPARHRRPQHRPWARSVWGSARPSVKHGPSRSPNISEPRQSRHSVHAQQSQAIAAAMAFCSSAIEWVLWLGVKAMPSIAARARRNVVEPISLHRFVSPEIYRYFHRIRPPHELLPELDIDAVFP
jgi:hypothetical protein